MSRLQIVVLGGGGLFLLGLCCGFSIRRYYLFSLCCFYFEVGGFFILDVLFESGNGFNEGLNLWRECGSVVCCC